jgi:hypothetical protein
MRKARAAFAGIACAGAAIAGVALADRRRLRRADELRVTVFSEPGYRGVRRELVCGERVVDDFYSLSELRIPRVGSIKVERVEFRSRPVFEVPELLWSAHNSPEDPDAALWRHAGISALPSVLDPRTWLAVREPDRDRESWVRLWAAYPWYPLPRVDGTADPEDEPWHDILGNTPDLGGWTTRVQFLELGVRNPNSAYRSAPGNRV